MKVVSRMLLGLIRIYQKTLSPDHGILFSHMYPHGCCKFYPTCSQYAHDAISKHGALSGSWMATKRVLRCNPMSDGGIDEVPTTKKARR